MPGSPLKNLPLPALFAFAVALWTLFQLVVRDAPVTATAVVAALLGGALFAGLITAVVAVRRRRLGGTAQVSDFDRALRTGSAPASADTGRWTTELDRLDRTRTAHALAAVALSLLPLGLGVWGLSDPESRPAAVLLLLLFLGVDAVAVGTIPTQRRRVARLREALTGRGPDSPA